MKPQTLVDDTVTSAPAPALRTVRQERCPVCSGEGRMLYRDLRDTMYSAPGHWTMFQCLGDSCGALWLDPVVDVRDLGQIYLDYYTHEPAASLSWLSALLRSARRHYVEGRFGYPASGGRLKRTLASLLAMVHPGVRAAFDYSVMYLPNEQGRLLDVGCGSGVFLSEMRELGWKVAGIDPDPTAVAVARQAGLEVSAGDLADQNFPQGSFDVITLRHVLEHLHDAPGVLAQCCRLLKPGGRVILATPNAQSLGHEKFGRHWMPLSVPHHLCIYTPQAIPKLAEAAGMRVHNLFTTVRAAHLHYFGSTRIRKDGRYTMGRRGWFGSRAWSHVMQYRYQAKLWTQPDRGEEIVAVLMRDSSA